MTDLAEAETKQLRRLWTRRIAAVIAIVLLSLAVRSLTGYFVRQHFNDAAWFQYGSYNMFDRQTRDMLDHKMPFFWIDDPTRTDLMAYPPGFNWWMASIYSVTGDRSPAAVQAVTLVLDSFSVLLLLGIGVTAFGWRSGLAAAGLGALSPLLAFCSATPNSDAPTSWFVLASVWCVLVAARRRSWAFAILTGTLLGLACWLRVNPLFLAVVFSAALFLLVDADRRKRLTLSAAVCFSTLLIISPVIIRNLVVFYPDVAPTGLHVGWNMLAGIGETDRGPEFGAPCCDADIIAQDRAAMNLPPDAPLALSYPDGIRRDRDRGRRAIGIISQHPLWFAGVVAERLWGHLKYGGEPVPNVGTMGINVTAAKTLPPARQNGVLGTLVDILGMIQSVWRRAALPLMIAGIFIAFRVDKVSTWLMLSVILYYLATLGIGHSEIRYGLPMQSILIVFAGVTAASVTALAASRSRSRRKNEQRVA
jgi:hypothetical protein